ncbi:hypothetical protein AMECASPLE_013547 [Ameca splendens]|uniref:Uncharacterized protein n=1 Tax=Ameca splendens TaxID=208324 RepID=A0ABV0ZA87_9TELE
MCQPERNELTSMFLIAALRPRCIPGKGPHTSASFNSDTDGLEGRKPINNSLAHVFLIIHPYPQVIIRIIKAKHDCFCLTHTHTHTHTHTPTHTHTHTHRALIKSSETKRKGYNWKEGGVKGVP